MSVLEVMTMTKTCHRVTRLVTHGDTLSGFSSVGGNRPGSQTRKTCHHVSSRVTGDAYDVDLYLMTSRVRAKGLQTANRANASSAGAS